MKIELSKRDKEFLQEIVKIYIKYGLALGHEDTQGAFIIKKYSIDLEEWLLHAQVEYENRSN